jgi:hypothetical protein
MHLQAPFVHLRPRAVSNRASFNTFVEYEICYSSPFLRCASSCMPQCLCSVSFFRLHSTMYRVCLDSAHYLKHICCTARRQAIEFASYTHLGCDQHSENHGSNHEPIFMNASACTKCSFFCPPPKHMEICNRRNDVRQVVRKTYLQVGASEEPSMFL